MINSSINNKTVYAIGAFFIALIAALVYAEIYYVAAIIPAFLLIVGVALFRLDWLMYLIILGTPISLSLEKMTFNLGLILPTEPLMFGAMVVFLGKLFYDHKYDPRIIKHPITIGVIFYILWTGITAITSEMPIVSLKMFISRIWFVTTCYFIVVKIFKDPKAFHKYFWFFILPLIGVIFYTLYQHGIRGFEEKPAHWVMQPFFKDHTSYGAIIAFYIPILIGYLFNPHFRWNLKFITSIVLLIFVVGVIMSYTRAAWLSLVAAMLVVMIIKWRIHIKYLIGVASIVLVVLFSLQEQIIQKLEKNKQDSSGDFAEHVESMSNVASDASNLERLNRWSCAVKMFKERPVFGWGPGTYMFQYAPFQSSQDLTIISTNFGDLGNAHSEYLGPLAEQGVFGPLLFLILIFLIYYKGIPLYYKLKNRDLKMVLLTAIAALTTYLTHGVLNNFLDTDKASVPFWGCLAIITAIEVFHKDLEDYEVED